MNALARNWGWVALRGIAAVIFGVLTFLAPTISLATLVFLFGAYALANGVLTVASSLMHREGEEHWVWMLVLAGALSVAFGAFLFLRPGVGALAVVLWIGAYAVVLGAVLIGFALRLRRWKRESPAAALS